MRTAVLRVIGLTAAVVVVGGAIYLLREATMSTHYDTGPDSRMVVEVRAASNRAEEGVSVEELARAQLAVCALEVSRGDGSDVRQVEGTGDRFVITLRPALDSTDRKQYRGCLQDWSVNHVLLHVESMTETHVDALEGGDGA
jgi:hypothetical protein